MAFSLPVVVLVLTLVSVVSSSCQSFTSTICGDVISSYPTQQVYGDTTLLLVYESLMESYAANLTILGPMLVPDCYMVAKKFICGYYFPECLDGGLRVFPFFSLFFFFFFLFG